MRSCWLILTILDAFPGTRSISQIYRNIVSTLSISSSNNHTLITIVISWKGFVYYPHFCRVNPKLIPSRDDFDSTNDWRNNSTFDNIPTWRTARDNFNNVFTYNDGISSWRMWVHKIMTIDWFTRIKYSDTISLPNYTNSLGYGDGFVQPLVVPGNCGKLDVEDCYVSNIMRS